jgi:hypothetical protein
MSSFVENIKEFNIEFVIAFMLLITLSFFQVNVNEQLGNIFGLMVTSFVIGGIIIASNTNIRNTIAATLVKRNNNWIQSLMLIAGALGIFWFASNYVIQSTLKNVNQSVFQFLQDQLPLLSSDPTLNFVMIGQIVPIVESMLFFGILVTLICVVALREKEQFMPITPQKLIWVYGLITLIFTVFHFTAKFAQGMTAFIVTGIFALLSIALVFISKQMFEAIMLHLLINTISMRDTIR